MLLARRNHPLPQQNLLCLLEIKMAAYHCRDRIGGWEGAARAMKAGAFDFIEKPCRDEALIGAIESAMKRGARTGGSARIPEAAARIAVGLLQIADSHRCRRGKTACYPP
jgi:hypothetical protein